MVMFMLQLMRVRYDTWFKSLSTSTNDYQLKTVTNPVAGEAAGDNIYAYNLIATVTNSGEKITALEIDMNGKKLMLLN